LGFSNWPVIYYIFPRQLGSRSFLSPLPYIKEDAFTPSSPRHQQIFWRRCRGGKKTSARGVSHTHPLLCFKFCFTLFLLASFYKKPKKN
jgi:hypothetical protein